MIAPSSSYRSASSSKWSAISAFRMARLPYAAMSGTWLVLPTYNEAENIAGVVEASLAELARTGAHHVLVVDDNSPDGTGRIADRLAAANESVSVLHRPGKLGLGRAYIAG